MRGSIILVAGFVLGSTVVANAQAVSSGSISQKHRTHLARFAPAPYVAPSHRSAVATNRKPSEPETTGSIPKH
jgi:hypothetical protein